MNESRIKLPPMSAIAAMAPNRVIGCQGKLPWHLPEDLQFFKQLTMGSTLVMGRKTYESLPGPLPGRQHLVLTQNPALTNITSPEPVHYIDSIEKIAPLTENQKIFVVGGAKIYDLLLARCSELYLTMIHREYSGDTFFPDYSPFFKRVATLHQSTSFEIVHYRSVLPKKV